MEAENLNVDEIQQQLKELDERRVDLKNVLIQRKQQEKLDLVRQIKELIQEREFDVGEIALMLGPRRRRSSGGNTKGGSPRQYTKYVDPENSENVYTRGVVPGWMKDKMREQGYDPNSKEARDSFKKNHLVVVSES